MKPENENHDAAKKGLVSYGSPKKAISRNRQRKTFDSDKHLNYSNICSNFVKGNSSIVP